MYQLSPKQESTVPILGGTSFSQVPVPDEPTTVQPPINNQEIPPPCTSSEAQLLIATVRTDYCISILQKDLVDQMVQRDLLRLQYNRLQVEQARQSIIETEFYVGRVWLAIRKSGYYPSLACSDRDTLQPYGEAGTDADVIVRLLPSGGTWEKTLVLLTMVDFTVCCVLWDP
ncbi:hypothetical protein JVU11DRAFT_10524 [Chiua virens]|nr:hypothetical protein JVU11DRAFT_10524 [Chiua virens]